MADVTFLGVDQEPEFLGSWQLAKSLQTAQTAVTAALLAQSLRDVAFVEAFEVIPVSRYGKIRVQLWSVASNDNTDVVDLYGWSDDGPGVHFAKITAKYGNFTSAASVGFHQNSDTHESIRNEYGAATAYRSCDSYVATNNYYSVATVYTTEAEFPAHFMLDFVDSQFKYFGIAATTVGGTTCGAIFKPLSLRRSFPQHVVGI